MTPDEPATLHALRRRQVLKGALAAAAPLALPSAPAGAASAHKPLVVGGLPVTCNLTLPIACQARIAVNAKSGAGPSPFAYAKFSGWPEVKESLMTGRIPAAYMLAPLVMDLVDSRIPLKIVSLGHRSGAVIMVRTDSPARSFRDLRGKSIAIPSRFAVDYLFLRKMLARAGMTPKDITLIEMAPPDMPAALYARAVDAYCTGEPFGAAAQRAGYARPLAMTRDEWRNYICCVLTVREDLIESNPALVQDLVNHIQAAGDWLDKGPANRDKAALIASSRTYFGQDPKIIKFVMDNPEDRVTYGDLRLIRAEFDELMQLSVEAKTLKRPVAYERYVDERFYKNIKPVPIPL
ncbi:ABC transporter substrate-binding protein [Massilia sp. DD77]|uniref:ABC transporter substrate-binding protein n=1 Tax=Massilia sp. DD77 TaxID=3109349 RepID=UPI003000BB59